MATIRDVANRAQVSTATVSAVVNDSAYVSPELRARVLAAINELNYTPSLAARNLKRGRSQLLALVVADLLHDHAKARQRDVEEVDHVERRDDSQPGQQRQREQVGEDRVVVQAQICRTAHGEDGFGVEGPTVQRSHFVAEYPGIPDIGPGVASRIAGQVRREVERQRPAPAALVRAHGSHRHGTVVVVARAGDAR